MANNFKLLKESLNNPIEKEFERVFLEFDQLADSLRNKDLDNVINEIGRINNATPNKKVIGSLLKRLNVIKKQIEKNFKEFGQLYDDINKEYKSQK